MPDTVAAAKLVPEARHKPPPTQAPGDVASGCSESLRRFGWAPSCSIEAARRQIVRTDGKNTGDRRRNRVARAARGCRLPRPPVYRGPGRACSARAQFGRERQEIGLLRALMLMMLARRSSGRPGFLRPAVSCVHAGDVLSDRLVEDRHRRTRAAWREPGNDRIRSNRR